jgi:hypothetical protein
MWQTPCFHVNPIIRHTKPEKFPEIDKGLPGDDYNDPDDAELLVSYYLGFL